MKVPSFRLLRRSPLSVLQLTLIVRSGRVLLYMARDMHSAFTMRTSAYLLKIRLFAVTMGLLISASLTEAALIDNGGFTTDTVTGLDWLDMYHTDGNSYNQTLNAISGGGSLDGWRFATSAEFDGLINAAVGSSYTQVGFDAAILSQMTTLVNYLGSTYASGVNAYVVGYVDSSSLSNADARQFGWTIYVGEQAGYVRPASNTGFDAGKGATNSLVGAFLVRATAVPDTGSTAALLGVGVVALSFARRRLG